MSSLRPSCVRLPGFAGPSPIPARRSVRAIVLAVLACAAPAICDVPVPSEADIRAAAPAAPDYSRAESWAALPGAGKSATAVPLGASPLASDPQADTFYIHPTTDRHRETWNQDVADAQVNRWTDESVIARQGGAFNACCQVYAPYYRQSTSGAFGIPAVRTVAFDIAYSDVRRAFQHFLKIRDRRRPFILVGHSQGAAHAIRLLEEEIDKSPLADQLIAAYVIGIGVSRGEFGRRFKTLQPCDRADQVRCVASWNAMLPDGNVEAYSRQLESTYVERFGESGRDVLCTNPLTFTATRPGAERQQSRGAVPGEPGYGPPQGLVAHAVAAECRSGVLVVEPDPSLGLKPLPGGSMHYHDIGLFYEDVRENAALRTRAWLRAHRRR